MRVVIGSKTYSEISNLSFSPETDLVGAQISVNEFWVDVKTDDSISNGTDITLIDDLENANIWAKYWIVSAERIGESVVRVCAQSKITLLDRKILDAVMYENTALSQVLYDIFSPFLVDEYAVDQVFTGKTISGYCPEQTARERLLWVCFVLGGYLRTFFSDTIDILPLAGETIVIPPDEEYVVENEVIPVPIDKIFWRPSVSHTDVVTAVKVRKYSFTQGSPSSTDEYVEVGATYYIVNSQWVTLVNPDVPQTDPPNEIVIDGVTIINNDNVSAILSHLSRYYFNNLQIDLDVINNADYAPGEQLMVYTDEDTLMKGFVEQCNFRFGLQARSSIRLAGVGDPSDSDVDTAKLIIRYVYGTLNLDQKKYTFPVGYVYSIENPYIDATMNRHRYVYRPLNRAAEGTVAAGTNVNTQQYAIALDLEQSTKILHIISVDSVEVQTVDGVSIAVIDGGVSGGSGTSTGGSGSSTGGSGESAGGTGEGEGTETGGSGSGGSTGDSGESQGSGSSSPVIGSSSITSYPRQVYNSETGYEFTSEGLVVKHTTGIGNTVDVTSSCTLDMEDGDIIAIPDGVTEFSFPVNITYTYDGQSYTTSYTVTVYA